MPVITPAYPSMCATYNITRSAMTVIQQELGRGCDITDNIMLGKSPWSDLFVKHTFFTKGYKYYISVITASTDKEAHKIWSGYVESKVRVLVQGLEQHQSIALAHAFNKGYERRHRCANEGEISQVQAGSFSFLAKDSDVQQEDFEEVVKVEKVETAETKPDLSSIPGFKTEPTDDVPGPKTEEDETQLGVKTEGVKSEGEDSNALSQIPKHNPYTDVFTTTHYIGLTLSEGKSAAAKETESKHWPFMFLLPVWVKVAWKLIVQARNHLIFPIKSRTSRLYVRSGRNTTRLLTR